MTPIARTIATLVFGGSLLFAQLPNPLNLPDPLGITKKPLPAPTAPRAPNEGPRTERRPDRDDNDRDRGHGKYKKHGKKKGHDRDEDHDRGEHRGHDKD